jgi:hypothetical protein
MPGLLAAGESAENFRELSRYRGMRAYSMIDVATRSGEGMAVISSRMRHAVLA